MGLLSRLSLWAPVLSPSSNNEALFLLVLSKEAARLPSKSWVLHHIGTQATGDATLASINSNGRATRYRREVPDSKHMFGRAEHRQLTKDPDPVELSDKSTLAPVIPSNASCPHQGPVCCL